MPRRPPSYSGHEKIPPPPELRVIAVRRFPRAFRHPSKLSSQEEYRYSARPLQVATVFDGNSTSRSVLERGQSSAAFFWSDTLHFLLHKTVSSTSGLKAELETNDI